MRSALSHTEGPPWCPQAGIWHRTAAPAEEEEEEDGGEEEGGEKGGGGGGRGGALGKPAWGCQGARPWCTTGRPMVYLLHSGAPPACVCVSLGTTHWAACRQLALALALRARKGFLFSLRSDACSLTAAHCCFSLLLPMALGSLVPGSSPLLFSSAIANPVRKSLDWLRRKRLRKGLPLPLPLPQLCAEGEECIGSMDPGRRALQRQCRGSAGEERAGASSAQVLCAPAAVLYAARERRGQDSSLAEVLPLLPGAGVGI